MGTVTSTPSSRTYHDILTLVKTLAKSVVHDNADHVDSDGRFPAEAFAALKEHDLLTTYVPKEFGGDGLSITELSKLCEILGQYCASTAMVYAMHQIQVACIVDHGAASEYFRRYMASMVEHQYLLASATTELGVGGDVRSSLCAVEREGEQFTLEKKAPVISYGEQADAILVTARRALDAPASDQVHVLVNKGDYTLEKIADWDTMGFRGTCSDGFIIRCSGAVEQILPAPYADILSQSMHPVSHLTWGSLWTGIASGAVKKARKSVRDAMRHNPNVPPISSLRLSEVDELLFSMRGGLYQSMAEYQALQVDGDSEAFSSFGFSVRMNNVKIRCSEMVVDIVGKSLLIVGITGYKNNHLNSLSRPLRDAYGAALMVNNDRIRGHNATMQIALRDS